MSFLSNLKVEAGSDWCEIGVSYQAVDGLTVTLHSFQIIEKTGSYQYTITYTLENNTPDKKILEGAFKSYIIEIQVADYRNTDFSTIYIREIRSLGRTPLKN